MPTLVVNDNSWGEGIGALLGGMSAGNDPQKRMQAALAQARIDAQSLAARQTQIENEKLILQRQAEDRAIAAVGGELTPEKFHRFVPEFVEQPRPTSDFVGPMPVTAPNPDRATLPSRLAAARAIAENALRRGGTSEQALRGAYGGLGYGQLYAAGIPKDENEARRLTGLVEGKIPSANVPMTEGARRAQAEEAERAAVYQKQLEITGAAARNQADIESKERIAEQERVRKREEDARKDVVIGSGQDVILGGGREVPGYEPGQRVRGQTAVGDKTIVYGPDGKILYRGGGATEAGAPGAPKTPEDLIDEMYPGTSEAIVATRVVLKAQSKVRRLGIESLTPEERDAWARADATLHGEKIETRAGRDPGTVEHFTVRPGRTPGFLDPSNPVPVPPKQPGPSVPAAVPGQPDVGEQTRVLTPGSAEGTTVKPGGPGTEGTTTTTPLPGGGTVARTVTGTPQPDLATADRSNAASQTRVIELQAAKLAKMITGGPEKPYVPTKTEMLLGSRSRSGEPGLGNTVWDYTLGAAQNLLDPRASIYQTHSGGLINALTRLESGAAIGEREIRRYWDTLIPNALDDTPEKRNIKLQLINNIVEMRRQNLSNDEIKKWVLAKSDEREAAGLPMPHSNPGSTGGAGAAPAARTPGVKRMRVNPVTNELEDVR